MITGFYVQIIVHKQLEIGLRPLWKLTFPNGDMVTVLMASNVSILWLYNPIHNSISLAFVMVILCPHAQMKEVYAKHPLFACINFCSLNPNIQILPNSHSIIPIYSLFWFLPLVPAYPPIQAGQTVPRILKENFTIECYDHHSSFLVIADQSNVRHSF